MSDTKIETTDFRIKKIEIIDQGQRYDISFIFQELNLYDNLFSSCASGSVLVIDAVGLFDLINKNGNDKQILIQIDKGDDNKDLEFHKEFQINDITHIKNVNTTSKSYIITFISKTFFVSQQQKVDIAIGYPPEPPHKYVAEDSPNVVKKILKDYLGHITITGENQPAPPKDFCTFLGTSKGFKRVNIPSLKPLDAIEWCAYRAVKNDKPEFFFFETHIDGFRFISLSDLFKKPVKYEFNFGAKRINYSDDSEDLGSIFEFLGVRNFKFNSSRNLSKNINSGVYGGVFRGYDPLIRKKEDKNFKTQSISLLNGTLIKPTSQGGNNSRLVTHPYQLQRESHSWILKKDSSIITYLDDTENYAFARKAIVHALTQRTIELAIPGNFALTSGSIVQLNVPHYSNESDDDPILTGKYLITGVRHILRYNIHETIVTLSTNSTKI